MKFHNTPDGPKECDATKRSCKYGVTNHFPSEAEAHDAYEREQQAKHGFGEVSKRDYHLGSQEFKQTYVPDLPEVVASVGPLAEGRYYGSSVPKKSVAPFLQQLREELGPEQAEAYEKAKAARDKGYHYHLTVTNPQETRKLPEPPALDKVSITYHGLGRAVDGDEEAYFVVASSPEIAEWRREQGLPPKDLHVTLGFKKKDVHTQSKGLDALL